MIVIDLKIIHYLKVIKKEFYLLGQLTIYVKKVLLIDLDGQANMTTGLAIPYNAGPDAYDTILKVRKYTQAVKLNDLLYIIPGSRRTALMDMEKDTEKETEKGH